MGYACPVCEDPQADETHLANHLAFTAILGDEDHESWLDEHAPTWNEQGEAELGAQVAEFADDIDFPQVFENTTGHAHDHGHDHADEPRSGALFEDDTFEPRGQGGIDLAGERPDATVDGDTAEVLEEALEMTQQMLDEREDEGQAARSDDEQATSSDDEDDEDDGDRPETTG